MSFSVFRGYSLPEPPARTLARTALATCCADSASPRLISSGSASPNLPSEAKLLRRISPYLPRLAYISFNLSLDFSLSLCEYYTKIPHSILSSHQNSVTTRSDLSVTLQGHPNPHRGDLSMSEKVINNSSRTRARGMTYAYGDNNITRFIRPRTCAREKTPPL